MDWLNYHHLYYFWMVAREGGVSKAAAALRLEQPTVSAQLRLLERAFGQKLFVKRGKNLVMTAAGATVFRYADDIFSLGQELQHAMRGGGSEHETRFNVGISDTLPRLTTYRLIEPALQLQPPVRLNVRSDKTERLLTELAVHQLDIVLADTPMPPSANVRAFNHLLGESGMTVFGTRELATRYGQNFPASLHSAPMILRTRNSAARQSMDLWFDFAGIAPKIVAEIEDAALLQVFGQHSLGLFAAPTVVERDVCEQYKVQVLGRLDQVRVRFYAISVERRIRHPAVVAISESAKNRLFQ